MAYQRILITGDYLQNNRAFAISLNTLKKMVGNFKDKTISSNKLPVFINHPKPGEEYEAVAWIDNLKIERDPDKSWWLSANIDWTNEAVKKDIEKNKSWQYCSIEADLNHRHPNTGENVGPTLTGLALTNQPFIRRIPEIRFSQKKAESLVYLSHKDLVSMASNKKTKLTLNVGSLSLATPPGMESLIQKLKDQYPGEPEKAYATAWAIYNGTVKHSAVISLADGEGEMAPTDMPVNPLLAAMRDAMGNPELSLDEALAALMDLLAGSKQEETAEGEPSPEVAMAEDAMVVAPEVSEEEDKKKEEEIAALQASKSTLNEVVTSLNEQVAKLSKRLENYESKEIDDLVVSAIKANKISASQKAVFTKLARTDRAMFSTIIKDLPTNAGLNDVVLLSNKSPEPLNANEVIDSFWSEAIAKAGKKIK